MPASGLSMAQSATNNESTAPVGRHCRLPSAGVESEAWDIADLRATLGAFCIWLGVRIANRRERWAKRTAVALAILVMLNPISAGPLAWLIVHDYMPNDTFYEFYSPVSWLWTYDTVQNRSDLFTAGTSVSGLAELLST